MKKIWAVILTCVVFSVLMMIVETSFSKNDGISEQIERAEFFIEIF